MADINTRSSGLIDNLNQFNFHILGCGAIGSSAATQLARMGAENFALYDMDKVETANIGVSQYTIYDVGHLKVDMLKGHLKNINDFADITCDDRMFQTYLYLNDNDIIILGFDSMEVRLEAVKALMHYKQSKPFLLIDGRMGAEHYQQYTFIAPSLKKYEKSWYSDDEGSEEPCNRKATSYCSNMAGSFIANTVRKVATKQPYEAALSFNFPTMTLEKNSCFKY
jgi:molybdopterin/thiamine biosynthesis adenylyltransferase